MANLRAERPNLRAERPFPFGQVLREFRVNAALTQEELAEKAGLSPRGISDLERGARRSPHPATVRRIAVALRLADTDRAALELAARPPRAAPAGAPGLRAQAKVLSGAGALAFQMVDYDRAQAVHAEALELYRELGDTRGIASILSGLAIVTSERGNRERALELFQQVLELSLEIDDRPAAANALGNLGITARRLGQLDQANDFLERALDLHQTLGNRAPQANVIHSLGNVAFDRGDLVEAGNLFREALAVAHEHRDWGSVARCIGGLASIMVMGRQHRQLSRAAQLFGAVEALREAIDIPITSGGRAAHASVIALLERSLSKAEFAAAWKRGRALSRDRAIKLALG